MAHRDFIGEIAAVLLAVGYDSPRHQAAAGATQVLPVSLEAVAVAPCGPAAVVFRIEDVGGRLHITNLYSKITGALLRAGRKDGIGSNARNIPQVPQGFFQGAGLDNPSLSQPCQGPMGHGLLQDAALLYLHLIKAPRLEADKQLSLPGRLLRDIGDGGGIVFPGILG